MKLFEKNTPRWIVFTLDMAICTFSLVLALMLRFNFTVPEYELNWFLRALPYLLAIRAFSFFIAKTYQGIIRYTSSKDAQRIFIVVTLGSISFAIINLGTYFFSKEPYFFIPYSIVIIDFLATTFIMISTRLMIKALYFELKNPGREKRSVIIFGAGESGIITKRTLDRDAGTKYKVLAFIDDAPGKAGKKLEGVTIYSFDKLEELLKSSNVAHVVISVQNLHPKRKQDIVDLCLNYNSKVLNVPPVSTWINGELSFKQIKKVRIEDLLERDPIKLDEEDIHKQISGKSVLITGAAGSIGNEMVRQIIRFNPGKLILLDQAESPLYDAEMELNDKYHFKNFEVVIGDIRNSERMENLFKTFRPQLVYHAAAYKHVPMMEHNPSEAVRTNVLGTKVIADLSVKYNVEKFVMVSTDKAVNPTNVMGASKRIAEMYTQSLSAQSATKFVTTRFGNVLGSNGSVIPRFKQQIEAGGPVTITHPDITRDFMTSPEACQLVLEAGAMGKGGEIFIFDMGQSVKIVDLAKKMIQLSGLTLGKDIQIVYTGLRPGEKLYEELLNDQENTVPTHHSQIMIARVKEYDFESVSENICSLISLFDQQDNKAIVSKMKEIVPEFKSNNSVYEELDEISNT